MMSKDENRVRYNKGIISKLILLSIFLMNKWICESAETDNIKDPFLNQKSLLEECSTLNNGSCEFSLDQGKAKMDKYILSENLYLWSEFENIDEESDYEELMFNIDNNDYFKNVNQIDSDESHEKPTCSSHFDLPTDFSPPIKKKKKIKDYYKQVADYNDYLQNKYKKSKAFIENIIKNITNERGIDSHMMSEISQNFLAIVDKTHKVEEKSNTVETVRCPMKLLYTFLKFNKLYLKSIDASTTPLEVLESFEFLELYASLLSLIKNSNFPRHRFKIAQQIFEKSSLHIEKVKHSADLRMKIVNNDTELNKYYFYEPRLSFKILMNLLKLALFIIEENENPLYEKFMRDIESVENMFNEYVPKLLEINKMFHFIREHKKREFIINFTEFKNKEFMKSIETLSSDVEIMKKVLLQELLNSCRNQRSLLNLMYYGIGGLMIERFLLDCPNNFEAQLIVESYEKVNSILEKMIASLGDSSVSNDFNKMNDCSTDNQNQTFHIDDSLLYIITMHSYVYMIHIFLMYICYNMDKVISFMDKYATSSSKAMNSEDYSSMKYSFRHVSTGILHTTNILSFLRRNKNILSTIISIHRIGSSINENIIKIEECFMEKVKNNSLVDEHNLRTQFMLFDNIIKSYEKLKHKREILIQDTT